MTKNHLSEVILNQHDLFDLQMRGIDITHLQHVICDDSVDITALQDITDQALKDWRYNNNQHLSLEAYDAGNQRTWFMPDDYRDFDIAAYLLDLCDSQEKLQRVGEELLMFQERDLMDLLRYMKYLTDVMRQHGLIWGVGRGSSVASYVLYLLGVHRIDSMYYDLDPREFLR